jgi:hypothetical protein
MRLLSSPRYQRRQFLQTVSGLAAGAFGAVLARADDLPKNTNPRAVFGDAVEPDWKQRVTIAVGPKQADLVGTTDRVIQADVDYVARRGGDHDSPLRASRPLSRLGSAHQRSRRIRHRAIAGGGGREMEFRVTS